MKYDLEQRTVNFSKSVLGILKIIKKSDLNKALV